MSKKEQNNMENVTSLIANGNSTPLYVEKVKEKDKIEVPGCTANERDAILNLLYKKLPTREKLYLPNWRKLALNSFFLLVLPLLISLILVFNIKIIQHNEDNYISKICGGSGRTLKLISLTNMC